MRNTTEREWKVWGALSLIVPIGAVLFLIAAVVNSFPDSPTRSDARAEASNVLQDVDSGNLDGLRQRISSVNPPGASEIYDHCRVIAPSGRTIRVSGNSDHPLSFRIAVEGHLRRRPAEQATCVFGLSRKNRHWTLKVL